MSHTVLMTCIGGFYGYETLQALRADAELKLRVVGTDAAPDVAVRHFCDAFAAVPRAGAEAERFVDALFKVCQREAVEIVVPGADEEAIALARSKSRFEKAGIRCAVNDAAILDLITDKLRILEHLKRAGIDVPPFATAATADDVPDAAKAIGYPAKPVLVKPRRGRGARGIHLIEAGAGKVQPMPMARDMLRGDLDSVAAEIGSQGGTDWLAMEFLPGDVFDVDVLARDGAALFVQPRRRLWPGPFSRGVEGHLIEDDAAVRSQAEQITKELRMSHCFDMDFGSRADGTPGLLEINPRWSGSVASLLHAGVNVPAMLIRSELGLPLPKARVRTGVRTYPVNRMVALAPEAFR